MTRPARPIGRYLFQAFGIAYGCWGAILALQAVGVAYGTPVTMILLVIGGNGPLIAGFLALRRRDPSFTLRRLVVTSFDVRARPLQVVLSLAIVAVYFGTAALAGGIASPAPLTTVLIAVLMIPLMAFGGGLEEVGWRHYLQPAMQERLPFVPATAVVSLIWIAWHLPLFLIVGTSQNGSNFLAFAATTWGLGFALGALHAVSGSAALCVLAHSAINSMFSAWPVSHDLGPNLVVAAALLVLALLVVGVGGQRRPRISARSKRTGSSNWA